MRQLGDECGGRHGSEHGSGQPAILVSDGQADGTGEICTVDRRRLLGELYAWQIRDDFQYRHHWEPKMLVMWDNRCILHRATGGYEGHDRLLHRTTVGYNAAVRTT